MVRETLGTPGLESDPSRNSNLPNSKQKLEISKTKTREK